MNPSTSSSGAHWSRRHGGTRAAATGPRDISRARNAQSSTSTRAAPLSQWKQLRQTVAIRQDVADIGSSSPVHSSAQSRVRISHLCPEDKQKVGKLIRQLMKVGGENEQLRKQVDDVTAVLDQAVADKDDLQIKLAQSLDMLKTYQARMHAMQAQSDMEQAKVTAAAADAARLQQQAHNHAHALQVLRLDHDDAMRKASRQWEVEMDRLREEIAMERRQRLLLAEQLDAHQRLSEDKDHHSDISSLLNLSSTDKVRDIVLEWKHRMDAALEPVLPTPVTSSQTQTDAVHTHTIGVQVDSVAEIIRIAASEASPHHPEIAPPKRPQQQRMLPSRTSMVDSECVCIFIIYQNM
ncbi:hypothetical protein, variant [Aphanomyces astaci]|uniref:Uncharacterized protein n=1 Tax=Aphanomyces astaci TaxID=112090 RepID=W4G5I5_APHAT|nr:hypothetical protein, variant [Aphanomyces astaci]ETV74188.1 hypothetical protein, variant [Aphanomyces astaci]|eukprot:XP_009836293.1 hypothetical protein, variant [Aphanomyces astaci]